MARPLRLLAALLLVTTPAGADPWDSKTPRPVSSVLRGPEPDHGDPQAKIVLPAVPAFEVPVAPAGTYGVRELLVAGKPLLGKELEVTGYVTWIYDCAAAVRRPGQSAAKTQKMIDEDPTLCERAKFYLGDTRTTAPDKSLWVVDVPRVYNKLELLRIKKADRTLASFPDRCEPDKKRKHNLCVPLAVGDYVKLKGKLALQSPHNEANSDGLIVFAAVAPATPPAQVTMKALPAPARRTPPALAATPVARPPASEAARKDSIRFSNEATRAYGMQDYPLAIDKYRESTKAWEGNHVAWYGAAGAHIGQRDWKAAVDAVTKAFEVAPTDPMYAMVLGYCLYEQAVANAPAPRDLSKLDFTRAEQLLRHAVQLDPKLWRAHYYLGRIARDGNHAKEAAEHLTRSLAAAPTQPGPWIALAELYRKWQYPDLALKVIEQATPLVPGPPSSDVWYVIGMTHDDQRRDKLAVAAFTKALEADPANSKALFQRGQAYARLKKRTEAKRDLEAFVASPAQLDFAKQQANKLLLDLAAKR